MCVRAVCVCVCVRARSVCVYVGGRGKGEEERVEREKWQFILASTSLIYRYPGTPGTAIDGTVQMCVCSKWKLTYPSYSNNEMREMMGHY